MLDMGNLHLSNRLRIMYSVGLSLVLTTGFAEGSLINIEFESVH